MHQRYICVCVSVPLSPGFSMSQFWSECDKLWSTALLMWPDPVLHSCKRARPFFYGTPEWGRSVCVKDGVMGVMNEEEKHISSHCVWACTWHRLSSSRAGERLRLQRGESWPQICPTAAGGLPADCSPPLQCDHSGRRSDFFFFSIPLPFPATPKGNALQMPGKRHGRASELWGGLKIQATEGLPDRVLGSSGPDNPHNFNQDPVIQLIPFVFDLLSTQERPSTTTLVSFTYIF